MTAVRAELRDSSYCIELRIDVDALALGVSPAVPSAELDAQLRSLSPDALATVVAHAHRTIRRRVRVRFDDIKVTPDVSFPEYGMPQPDGAEPTLLGTVARLEGLIPQRAVAFRFGASRAFGVVHLDLHDSGHVQSAVLEPGADATPHRIGQPPRAERVLLSYVFIGFEHILPKGLDHILFVLALVALNPRGRPLLWQVSAFTVAHSVTLGLAMWDIVRLPAAIVEPVIALSLVVIAGANVVTPRVRPARLAIVFGFGLLHGLGFAGVLTEVGLPARTFGAALIGFNVGVELGQLAIVGLALLAIGWLRNRLWYRARVTIPLSSVIGVVGMVLTAERCGLLG